MDPNYPNYPGVSPTPSTPPTLPDMPPASPPPPASSSPQAPFPPQPTDQPAATPTVAPSAPQSYLDAIAAQPKPKFLSGKMIALLAGAVAALIIVIIIGVTTNNARQAAQNEINALSTELNNLQAILKYAQSNPLSNSTTAKLATETDLITISHQNDLSKVYTSIDPNAPIDPEAAVTTDLNEAKARGSLDSSYATALREQLLTVCNKLESLYDSATDDQKTALEQTFTDFKELASRLPSST